MAATTPPRSRPAALQLSSEDDFPEKPPLARIPSGMMSPGMALFHRVMTPKKGQNLKSPRKPPTPRLLSPRISQSPRSPKMIIKALRSKKNVLAKAKAASVERPQIPIVKKKPANQKKKSDSILSKGHVRFVHASRLWGKIRLNTSTKWGEDDVWFHVDKCSGRRIPMLGDDVNVEYVYTRKRGLRALSVKPITTTTKTAPDWRSSKSGTKNGGFTSFKSRNEPGRRSDQFGASDSESSTSEWRSSGKPRDYASFKSRHTPDRNGNFSSFKSRHSPDRNGDFSSFKSRRTPDRNGDFSSFKSRRTPDRNGNFSSFKSRRSPERESDRAGKWQTVSRHTPSKATKKSKASSDKKRRVATNPKATPNKKANMLSAAPKPTHNALVAKGPAPNGHRGFRFRRSVAP